MIPCVCFLDYLKEVDRVEKSHEEETKAQEIFKSGETGVVAMLEKVRKPEQLPVYYSGGFRIMCSFLAKSESHNWELGLLCTSSVDR